MQQWSLIIIMNIVDHYVHLYYEYKLADIIQQFLGKHW